MSEELRLDDLCDIWKREAVTAADFLSCYKEGLFFYSAGRETEDVIVVSAKKRAVISLPPMKISRSIRRLMKQDIPWNVTFNQDFDAVIEACARTKQDEQGHTWINRRIERIFKDLHRLGHAHSIEIWDQRGFLIGGVYGLAQGGCFNGESAFGLGPDIQKFALGKLVEHLVNRGFILYDTQLKTPGSLLSYFNCEEIMHSDYVKLLREAQQVKATFVDRPAPIPERRLVL